MATRVLVTGAAGRIGRCLAEGLPAYGHALRLLDRVPIEDGPHETVTGDVTDPAVLARAMEGAGAVVHLAGIPSTAASHEDLLTANIEGTYRVFEAARLAGAERVVFASSNHAVGFTPRADLVPADTPIAPDSHYGVSKAYGEALGRYYADRYGMRVASLRIGTFAPRPPLPRALSTWLSPADAVRLVHACLIAPDLTYAAVWGVSANTRNWWDLSAGRALGYEPRDDAEAYAGDLPELDPGDPEYAWLGGRVVES
ncbi:NAD-dependent dehydratase [Sphaerisporangium siamense]|uniref:Uronate dehydrogenase n=1 Tax=Sphaerisporangium siamense TaxID=795645 RepID=A0A7W7DEI9_9ACTN|nr:NAD(P)-dependent oxidoreductase [Sphaerisporangium siamense]MBB4705405.1 uronate dehydrogenase [Sphaerisporangium siamense]GII86443.1 NAD-dependent dehydratase [Sphaerisporangium siamense]